MTPTRRTAIALGLGAALSTVAPFAFAQSVADIKKKGELTIGMLVDFPPYGTTDAKNQPDGYDADVAKLLAKGPDAFLKKIGEEATETVMAAKDARVSGDKSKVLYECADLWFHSMVLLAQFDLQPQDVLNELARREGLSGLEEKAARKD